MIIYCRREKTIFAAQAKEFEIPSDWPTDGENSHDPQERIQPTVAKVGSFPAQAKVGRMLKVPLYDMGKKGEVFLVESPPGAYVADQRVLTWTPKRDQVGVQSFTIRIEMPDRVDIRRDKVQVVAQ